MKTVCATASVIHGIDVSSYQANIDWKIQAASGVSFAFIKASEGISLTDFAYANHRAGARAAGIPAGAYHFFHPTDDPNQQAIHFGNVVGKRLPGELLSFMDWETTDGVPTVEDKDRGLAFLQKAETLLGPMGIYGGPYFLQALALDLRFAKYPLWVAHYGVKCPLVPEPWVTWNIWQYTSTGGDKNEFQGTLDQLKALG